MSCAFSTVDDAADRRNSATVGFSVGVEIYTAVPPTLWVSAQSGTLSMSCMSPSTTDYEGEHHVERLHYRTGLWSSSGVGFRYTTQHEGRSGWG